MKINGKVKILIGVLLAAGCAFGGYHYYTVQQAATLRSRPNGGSVVRALPVGLRLYPTGNREGVWWEVMDDNDNLGWVQNERLAPGR